ncbi:hypothetical protein RclHR1_07970008 [Rhizophagus clarus]|uniref:Uncharacterized protein n=1 Tax=Rhizophagus clarus TaxID=94130 RepID=A0A2Z6RZ56_9GLOM|nr:hypothetical protein RclHR1_07970008 [Rhizophagus clarus]GES98175.1 hypothetical protein GLOIN_2v1761139 [Rhizophagus clarus]
MSNNASVASYNNAPCQQPTFNDSSYNTHYFQQPTSEDGSYNNIPYQQQISNIVSHNNIPNDTSPNSAFYQPSMSSDTLLKNAAIPPNHNHGSLNNISHNNYQQSTSNSISNNSSQPQFAIQNSPQPNIFPPINPSNITINSTYVIVIPAGTNPDIQNQFQQVHTYLNNSASTINSQTRT